MESDIDGHRAADRLRRVLEDRTCPCILFVGSGCHRYLKQKGVQYPATEDSETLLDWAHLLRAVGGDDDTPRHADNTAIWESIVARCWHKDPTKSPQDHENEMLKDLRKKLEKATPKASDRDLRAFGERLRSCGINAIITLNFDRTLDRALQRSSRRHAVRRQGEKNIGAYRAQLHAKAGGLRVWHPHGMAEKWVRYRSIQLGLVSYADTVSALRDCYAAYRKARVEWLGKKTDWKRQPGPGATYWPSDAFTDWAHERLRNVTNWLEVFLMAHVIFIGCGLSHAEVDVWYALHARQREHLGVPEGERPQTLFLHPREKFPAHIKTRPAGILPVFTDSHEEAWALILGE